MAIGGPLFRKANAVDIQIHHYFINIIAGNKENLETSR